MFNTPCIVFPTMGFNFLEHKMWTKIKEYFNPTVKFKVVDTRKEVELYSYDVTLKMTNGDTHTTTITDKLSYYKEIQCLATPCTLR